jgi:hypothetical protein
MMTGGNRDELQKRLNDFKAGNADLTKMKKVKKPKKPKPTIDPPTNEAANVQMKKVKLTKQKKKKETKSFISDSEDDAVKEATDVEMQEEQERGSSLSDKVSSLGHRYVPTMVRRA